jgi:CRISPR system Cascade subunit CasA
VAGVQTEVGGWLTGAELAAQHLRDAIKEAWFGHQARGNLAHVDATFWSATETPFYRQLQALVEAARAGTERDPLPDREAWHRTLTGTALRLFDEVYVGAGPVERQNPRRVAQAQRRLASSLHGSRLKAALGLPVPQAADKPRRGRSTKAAETAPKEPE